MARSLAQPVRMVWALCLAVGTCTHVAALIYGWNDRVPFASLIFWNALTVLDPLAAVLLFLRPRIGVVVTLAIMVSDVGHNIWAIGAFQAMVWPVVAETLFLIFVLATAHLIWRDATGQGAQVRTGSKGVTGSGPESGPSVWIADERTF